VKNGETTLVDASGRPIGTAAPKSGGPCPRCQAPATRRVLSGGFGQPHDVCGACGHDFPERTL
jgi:uncharacterized protein (DUF983 family)